MATHCSSLAARVCSRINHINFFAGNNLSTQMPIVLAVACLLALLSVMQAQTPVAIPQTATLLAGGATAAGTGVSGMVLPASGSVCFAGSSLKATDAFGDGCPGPYAQFSADFRGGVVADGAGNVYIIESTQGLLRKIDAKSGIVTAVTGTAITGCATNSDGYGDGCPVAQTKLGAPRGGGIDPYGNVILAGYNMNTINIVCNAVSPLCPNTANHKQVGSMYRIAGCVGNATAAGSASVGATAGTAGDGLVASPFGNLAGDVSDWGAGSAAYGTCASTLGGVDQARGATADKYGNVYIADTANLRYRVVVGPATFMLPNGTVLTNPLANIIKLNPTYSTITPATAYGHIYPILGTFSTSNGGVTSPTTAGTACAGPSGGATLDTIGDGCPFYESTGGVSSSSTLGVGIDSEGNPIFLDQNNKVVRVLYLGGPNMASAIQKANNSVLTIIPGYIYPLIGLGGVANPGISYTPTLGTATAINSNGTRMAVDLTGNLYFSDYGKNSVYMFDLQTGYARNVLATGTNCSIAAPNHDSVGDGCSGTVFGATTPVASSFYFGGPNTLGIAFDPQGNLIVGDITNSLIRKITATALAPVRVGTSLTQLVTIHAPAGATGITASLLAASPDITAGAITCATAANADTTLDCQVPITFAPITPGQRSAVLTVSDTGIAGTASFAVTGTATGAALVADVASPTVTTIGTVTSATSLAVDGSGNVFTIDSGKFIETSAAGTSAIISGTPPSTPYQVAVDAQDNVYATNGGSTFTKDTLSASGTYSSSIITPLLPIATYAATPAALNATPAIYGIAVDRLGNIFFSDRINEAIFEIPAGGLYESLNQVVPVVTGFATVGELALDGAGNLLIADTGAGKVYRLLANTPLFPTPTIASALAAAPINAITVASSVAPTHIAADTAGNAYIQDATARTVTEIPLSGATATVYSTVNSPQGIAAGSNGSIYEAEASLASINAIQRQNVSFNFGTSNATTFSATLTDVGNLAATSINQTDTGDFQVRTGTTSGCNVAAGAPQTVGTACTISANFTPQCGLGTVTDVLSYLPAITSSGTLSLSGIKNGSVVVTTTSIGSPSPASPIYVANGTEVSFTVSVAAACGGTGNASGAVAITIDTATPVSYNLDSNGQVIVPIIGLSSGSHSITAVYASQNGFSGSNAGPIAFNIAQAVTTIGWTPATTTQQYSAAIGSAVLNAGATSSGVPVQGSVIYTATPNGGSATPIHSASYLPLGTYTLAATFVPLDSVNFSTATGSISGYTVTKATTTAAVGATQFLVASDATGNFSTVQAAVNALPTGGSVYIKPGTYPGFITVVQPNVALRGLGGDPTQVILTHEAGAFGQTYPYTGEFQATGINAGNGGSNGWQLPSGSTLFQGDAGSATLVAAKGVNTAISPSTTIPNGLYAENLSLINGYNTDTTTTTTTYEATSNGACAVNQGPATTYSALYNTGTLCGSQALAVWITADLTVMNNVYTASLQDTVYVASQGSGSNGFVPSRQYWFRGKVTGDVDFIFGDAAAVFDNTSIYTAWHGNTATGTETIHAQNKAAQTGTANDYLSGYVMNSDTFTSQSTGMTSLYFGRPYGTYSTWVMLNSYIDQVNPLGYTTGLGPALGPATFTEFNDNPYTDPATGSPDRNGAVYLGTGGNTGAGVSGPRETSSTNPGTPMNPNPVPTSMTQAQAQAYFPTNFLGQTVSSLVSSTPTWTPTAAIAANVNAFVPSGSSASVLAGSSVTILMRPQTPGLGAVTNGVYTIPTGSYTLTDTVGGSPVTLSSGTLDASGEAYYTSSALSAGTHNLTWTYSGDSNFAGSTTASAYVLTVNLVSTATTLGVSASPIVYGQSATLTATVSPTSGSTPTGSVTLTIDGGATQNAALTGGTASFTVVGLLGGSHTFTASYGGSTTDATSSTSASTSLTVNPAVLTVTGSCANRVYGLVNTCSASVVGYQYTDGVATVFSSTPTGTTIAARNSPAGPYSATPLSSSLTLTAFGTTNYTVNQSNTSFTISGGAPQIILFAPLPNFAHGGNYQLTARASSGLPVSYSVTSGNASVSGSTLTVTGAGTVTVQASQSTDPTGDYAAASPVTRSFTAQ